MYMEVDIFSVKSILLSEVHFRLNLLHNQVSFHTRSTVVLNIGYHSFESSSVPIVRYIFLLHNFCNCGRVDLQTRVYSLYFCHLTAISIRFLHPNRSRQSSRRRLGSHLKKRYCLIFWLHFCKWIVFFLNTQENITV